MALLSNHNPSTRDGAHAQRELLHIRIVVKSAHSGEECLWESEPTRGGNHISRFFEALEFLMARGTKLGSLNGATWQAFTNGSLQHELPISAEDLGLIAERLRARKICGVPVWSDEDQDG